ncbi:unnamed protein product [Caenorhabditis angaria]|uniref:Uncharacterized protein n=1 Tax=Caenorhabditis angaria TaxID=860376 RepID=A0A9P1IMD1_9PELO|nr:unnamed protein product [Caenorhabditis angaria]
MPRPFLKKGQGIARFQPRRSENLEQNQEKPSLKNSRSAGNLPRFTPTSTVPNSARTEFDSGISNEGASPFDDLETRPPTMSSLPIDRDSPSVLEENDLEASTSEDPEEEEIEEVSASIPSFLPASCAGSSAVSTNSSVLSADEKNRREIAKVLHQRAMMMNTLASVSPTSSSNISTPIGASTPITNTNTQQYQNLPSAPNLTENSGFNIDASLVTPRPFSMNRANLMKKDEAAAQTGASLLHRPLPRFQLQKNQQKENVYDLPQNPVPPKTPRQNYTPAERNLMVQLRDTIAHLDFAEQNLRSSSRKMKDEFVAMKNAMKLRFEKRKMELEEEYRRRFEEFEEEQKIENERIAREKRDLDRERKIAMKESGERGKERAKMIEDQRTRITELETQLAKYRHEQRSRDEKLRKKDEEMEKMTKELERSKKNCQTMEKRLRQMRNEKEKKEKEEEMFVKAEMRRNCPRRRNNIQEEKQQEIVKNQGKVRSVSWADSEEYYDEDTREDSADCVFQIPQEMVMKPAEKGMDEWGPFQIYRNTLGDFTKSTRTAENGQLFQYKNGDLRWINQSESIVLYISGIDGTCQVELLNCSTLLRFFVNRQFEIFRPNNMISMVNYHRNDIRTEVMCLENDYFYTELFDKNGKVTTKDLIQPDLVKKYEPGKNYSIRDSAYVSCQDFDDFEFVEPEFRLRYYKGAMIACKLFAPKISKNDKTLKLDINPESGEGKLESVQQYSSISGISQKKTIFTWPGPGPKKI